MDYPLLKMAFVGMGEGIACPGNAFAERRVITQAVSKFVFLNKYRTIFKILFFQVPTHSNLSS
jgi:hypothetical protein